ncbi:hypothetical protein VKT23_018858 [Stygiomarasmius scandens]|uniref:Cytochrome P450 n=1 Tax=Marasmiellus scandens TaxID=2682957 RepID=A0ABR1IR40_9AGAR
MDPFSPASLVIITALLSFWLRWRRPNKLPLPPGPRGLPLIGNLLGVITDKSSKPQYLKYLELGRVHNSDIVHIDVCGDHIIVLNSAKTVDDLLERRSSNYSDRPPMPMMNDLVGWNEFDIGFMKYSDSWKLHRRTFNQFFRPQAITSYHPVHRKEVTVLLNKLLADPENLHAHVQK